jgi:hypothetical protein
VAIAYRRFATFRDGPQLVAQLVPPINRTAVGATHKSILSLGCVLNHSVVDLGATAAIIFFA